MSGVKNNVQAENKGLVQVTNDDLREEGVGISEQPDEDTDEPSK
jgi:hypothetical protein